MDALVDRLVANAAIDRTTAIKALGIILGFLRAEGPADKIQRMIDTLPGAASAVEAASQGSVGVAGMMGGGIMAAGARLMAAGLGMDQIQTVAREVIAYARETLGPEAVTEIMESVPAIRQFA